MIHRLRYGHWPQWIHHYHAYTAWCGKTCMRCSRSVGLWFESEHEEARRAYEQRHSTLAEDVDVP